ncbi:ferritin-like domain-containing protein [Sessilibacter sp. MAH2]
MANAQFVSDIESIRKKAREDILQGALTKGFKGDVNETIRLLNAALSTEIICTLRYRQHYFSCEGLNAQIVADEFLEHSNQEQEHADKLAERICQLGGSPDMNPDKLSERSHSEYTESSSIKEMIVENLIAERIAIDSYREMIEFIGDKDPTTRRLLEEILAVEEEHADDLADLMTSYAVDTRN